MIENYNVLWQKWQTKPEYGMYIGLLALEKYDFDKFIPEFIFIM